MIKIKRLLFTEAIGKALAIILSIILARELEPQNFGEYNYYMSLVITLSSFMTLGLPTLLVREVSKVSGLIEFDYVKKTTNKIFSISSIIIILSFSLYWWINDYIVSLFFMVISLAYLRSKLMIYSSYFNGFEMNEISIFLPNTLMPLIFGSIFIYLTLFSSVDVVYLLGAQSISTTICLLIAIIILFMIKRKLDDSKPQSKVSNISKKSFTLLSLSLIVSTLSTEIPTLFLGEQSNMAEVGYFKVAMQISLLLIVPLNTLNIAMAPRISKHYNNGDIHEIQNTLSSFVRLSSLIFIFLLIIVIVVGHEVIPFIFGADYINSYEILLILLVGQTVNVLCGSSGLLLNMTNNEKYVVILLSISLLITGILVYLLALSYGGVGAAIAYSTGLFFWNVLLSRVAFVKLKLKTWIR